MHQLSQRFYFDWPQVDGTLVGEVYRVRVKFETTAAMSRGLGGYIGARRAR